MRIKRSCFPLIFIIFVITILLLANLFFISTEYSIEYIFIVITMNITIILTLLTYNGDIFYPQILVALLYIFIFGVCPIYLISIGETTCHGSYVMGGCIKATAIFLFGFCALLLGFKNTKIKNSIQQPMKKVKDSHVSVSQILIASYIIWFISWMISLFVMIKSGKSFDFIVSFGLKGYNNSHFNSFGDDGGIAFLGKMANAMVVPWLIICFLGRNKFLTIIISLLTLSSFFVTGFRYMIVIMGIAFIVVYYREKGTKPKIKTMLVFGIIGILFISILGYARASIRTGKSVDWSDFGLESIKYALVSNFNIFLPFYGLVEEYPENHFYTLGHSMIYESLIYFIPRAIWAGKPVAKISSSVAMAMMNSTNEFTVQIVGMAWPNIGEYYMEFGTIGVVIIMYIFGKILKKFINLYNSSALLDVIVYGISLGIVFQLITRGYTPNNLGFIVFLIIPLIPLYILKKKGEKRKI